RRRRRLRLLPALRRRRRHRHRHFHCAGAGAPAQKAREADERSSFPHRGVRRRRAGRGSILTEIQSCRAGGRPGGSEDGDDPPATASQDDGLI
uniref:Uncharacterized protein n=1 Tax=Triticum urartu TaxID=4572 RepID=A0A8R7TE65_TRIUA